MKKLSLLSSNNCARVNHRCWKCSLNAINAQLVTSPDTAKKYVRCKIRIALPVILHVLKGLSQLIRYFVRNIYYGVSEFTSDVIGDPRYDITSSTVSTFHTTITSLLAYKI